MDSSNLDLLSEAEASTFCTEALIIINILTERMMTLALISDREKFYLIYYYYSSVIFRRRVYF